MLMVLVLAVLAVLAVPAVLVLGVLTTRLVGAGGPDPLHGGW